MVIGIEHKRKRRKERKGRKRRREKKEKKEEKREKRKGKKEKERKMMKKGFGIVTILLVFVIVFCVKGTVMSKENHERVKQNHYYAVLEEEYVKRAEELLDKEGYMDCGINFTRVTYESGRREYTVLIHHRKIENLPKAEKARLWSLLSQVEFQDEACSFRYEL